MRPWGGPAAAALILWAPAVLAAPSDTAPALVAESTVTSYPPSFFAAIRPNTALDMINALPGFQLDTGGQVRGFGGAAGNVIIDGERPATKNDTLDQILLRIPATSVSRIDVIRGGAPGIDMHGKPLIANVVLKHDRGLTMTVQAHLSALFDGIATHGISLEAARRGKRVSIEGSLDAETGGDDGTGDGSHIVRDPTGRVTQADEEHYFGWAATNKATGAIELPALGGALRVEASLVDNPYWSHNHDLSPLPIAQQTEIFRLGQDTAEVGARYERPLSARLSLETYALQQLSSFSEYDNLSTPFDDTIFTLRKRQGESILRGTLTADLGPRLSIRSGAEGDYNWLVSRTADTDHGAPVFVPAANVQVGELRGEAFGDLTWRPTATLVVEGALRIEASRLTSRGDVNAQQSFVFEKPRLVATWAPDPARQLQVRIEREVSQLDFGNFTAQGSLEQGEHAGNPQLTPEQDWVIEATYDRHFWKGGDLNLAFRQYWLSDVIDFAAACNHVGCDPRLEFDAPANIGAGEKREFAAALTLPTDRLGIANGQLIMRATWRFSRVIDPSTHRPREISNLHPLDAEIHFTQGLPALKSTWGFTIFPAFRQRQFHFNEIDTQRLGVWIEVFFEYKPRPDLSVKLEGANLARHGMEQVRAFYDPFRNFGGGALSSVDTRDPHFPALVRVTVRKTFG